MILTTHKRDQPHGVGRARLRGGTLGMIKFHTCEPQTQGPKYRDLNFPWPAIPTPWAEFRFWLSKYNWRFFGGKYILNK